MKNLVFIFLFSAISVFVNAEDNIKLPAIFSDNMVLQQKSEVNIWGTADAGSAINVTCSWGESQSAECGIDGKWKLKVKTPTAGGPYELNITSGNENVNFKNVLIGEVWLCSGQSNMEMPLAGWPPNDLIEGSAEAIKNSANSEIRLFTVEREIAMEPKDNCVGKWVECNPENSASFSAAAYFFGKRLYEELKVPVGLIHSSWGGTPAEAWTSAKYLDEFPVYKNQIERLPESQKELKKLKSWLEKLPQINLAGKNADVRWKNINLDDADCSMPGFDDSKWPSMKLPTLWESTEIGNFDGAVWFRKNVELPENWLGNELTLELGPIDDMDITYVNGKEIGSYEGEGFYSVDRIYKIPGELNDNKNLSIAVRVIDNQVGGGIYGKSEKLSIYESDMNKKIFLAGEWKYMPVAEFANMKFYLFGKNGESYKERPNTSVDFTSHTPSVLYNGMIAPLIPFNIKGVIWYQGESNVGRADEYKKLFPSMIQNWRNDWNEGSFPFYFVQIAPYDYGDDRPSQYLREAQMETLSLENTGMAVTLDIGNPNNIHPGKKSEVGSRLALWALAKDYRKNVNYSGPIYDSYEIKGNKIVLSFKYAESGLKIEKINGSDNFEIAGKDMVYKNAIVEVDGDKLIVYNPDINMPTSVRYCWDNVSESTLFNNFGLPASSFRTK